MPRKKTRNAHGEAAPRRRQDKKWEVRVTYTDAMTGERKRKSLYADSQKEVLQKKKDFLAALEEGVYTPPTKWTLGGWLNVWVKEYTANLRDTTVVNYAGVIKNYIIPAMGNVKLSALTTPAVQAFYNGLSKPAGKRRALAPATINGIHAVLHSALEMAVDLEYVRSNPAARCKLLPIPKPEIKPMDEVTIAQFMEAVSGDEYERVLLLDLYTGLRKSELIGLSWDCIDFDKGTIHLYRQLRYVKGGIGYRFGPLKNGKSRTITPPQSAMRILQEQKRAQNEMRLRAGRGWSNPEGLVFTRGDGSHLCPTTLYEHYKAIVKRMGLPDLRVHDLRHTYATTSMQAGNDLKELSEALGHHSVAYTADTYVHPTERMCKKSAARMEAFMNSLKKPNSNL